MNTSLFKRVSFLRFGGAQQRTRDIKDFYDTVTKPGQAPIAGSSLFSPFSRLIVTVYHLIHFPCVIVYLLHAFGSGWIARLGRGRRISVAIFLTLIFGLSAWMFASNRSCMECERVETEIVCGFAQVVVRYAEGEEYVVDGASSCPYHWSNAIP